MKTWLLLSAAGIMGLLSKSSSPFTLQKNALADTVRMAHLLDGSASEWPAASLTTDGETGFAYGMDNDDNNLYLVMKVADRGMQIKMMRQGMNLYIDLKGKKKEGRGVGFPVKNDNAFPDYDAGKTNTSSADQPTTQQTSRKPDVKNLRMMMAVNLVALKVFGFGNDAPDEQQLKLPGSVNIAFALDSAAVLCIEYRLPLALLGDAASLNQKEISIGWKVNAMELPARQTEGSSQPTGQERGQGRGGRGGGYGRGGGNNNQTQMNRASMMQEQKLWAKYTILLK